MINIPLLQKFKGPYWAAVYVKVLEWKQISPYNYVQLTACDS